MDKKIITEEKVKEILNKILSEETSKVSRQDYSRVLFKIEELESSLSETIKEFKKLESNIPIGLQTLTNGRMRSIAINLMGTKKLLLPLKDRIIEHKRRASKSTINKSVDVPNFGDPSNLESYDGNDGEVG